MTYQNLPIHTDEYRSNSSPSTLNPQPSTSFDLPLLSRTTHATFARKTGLTTQKGRVYPQQRSPDNLRHHPEFFYVEWPATSEIFHEIHAPTLARITGNQAPPKHCFRLDEVAALIAAMHTIPMPQLLHACRPKA